MILGYPVYNLHLSELGIIPDKTVDISDELRSPTNTLMACAQENIDATCKILEWNNDNNINFYRISSDLFPHIANSRLLPTNNSSRDLVYDVSKLNLDCISRFINKSRLTFHPNPSVIINSTNKFIVRESKRQLFSYGNFLNMIGASQDSTLTIHGGGIYDNKTESIERWVKNFSDIPKEIRSRIALENDEFRFSIDDVLSIRDMVNNKLGENLPIILDLFHFECYEKRKFDPEIHNEDIERLNKIIRSWDGRHIKMHISEQKPGAVRVGAHSDYVSEIPEFLFNLSKSYTVYLMIEAKKYEQAVLFLKDKYKI